MVNRWVKKWKQWQILFSWAPKSLWTVTTAMKLKDACFLKEKQRDITLPTKAHTVKDMVFQQSCTDVRAEP